MKWYTYNPAPRTTGSECDHSELARSYAAQEFAAALTAAAALTNGSRRTGETGTVGRVRPACSDIRHDHPDVPHLQAAISDMESAIAELRRIETQCATAETRACLDRMERTLHVMREAVDEPAAT